MTKEMIKEMTVEEIKTAQIKIRTELKKRTLKDNDVKDSYGRTIVARGKKIKVTYKGAIIEGWVREIRPSTFTLEFKSKDGWKKISRYFYQVI
jgi:hypothetical protein